MMQMPAPDAGVIARRAEIAAALAGIVPEVWRKRLEA